MNRFSLGALARRLDRARRDDGGWVLPAVIGVVLMLLVMTSAATANVVSGVTQTSTDEDAAGATAAAYAAVQDYVARLNNNNTYFLYGNPSDPFSQAGTVTVPPAGSTNPAFGYGAGGSWATVTPASTPQNPNPTPAYFRYSVDNSQYQTWGIVRLLATGRVHQTVRSIVADVRQNGFISYAYFTNYETLDPSISSQSTSCAAYAWGSGDSYRIGTNWWSGQSNCQNIQFTSADTINGPVDSNDRLDMCGTTWPNYVTTADTDSPNYLIDPNCSAPISTPTFRDARNIAAGNQPVTVPVIGMPATNTAMAAQTYDDNPTGVPRPGCLYTGPTRIILNSNGTETVYSPFTKYTNVSTPVNGVSSSGLNPTACGSITALHSAAGATVTIAQNLIFVQNVPAYSADVNYTALVNGTGTGTYSNGLTCKYAGTANEGWTGISGNYAYPMSAEATPEFASSSAPAYGCRNGDAYVEGTNANQLTIAAANYIYVTNDIYSANSTSILGLVGQNAVWVWNPISAYNSNVNLSTATQNVEIDAAILSVSHTFMVENYQYGGNMGTLTVKGAIAQNFRGAVGTGSGYYQTGYTKNYNYDNRLSYMAPPKFLAPTSTSYGVTQYANVPQAYNPNGSPH